MVIQVFVVATVAAVGLLGGRLVANRTGIPDAAVYVVLGAAAAFLPGVPALHLSPDVVLLLFLPPLIYYAAFFSDPRESLRNLVAVLGQSVGLVVATAAVAAGALLVVFPDVGWAAALALGAAIAPPDPVAAGSALQRVGAPRRLLRVLESEGLINDGVALTVFAVAIGAVGADFTAGDVIGRLGIEVVGGIGFGLVVGVLAARLRGRVRDVPSQVVLSLVVPYLAFVPAQMVHSSGVLATVTTAVWLGTRGRGLVEPRARLQTETFWRALNTLLAGVLFVLLGMQVPTVFGVVDDYSPGQLVLASAAVVIAAVAMRLVWVLLVAPLLQRLPVREDLAAHMPWQERVVLAWCGPRGAVSLAVALSIPLTTAAGDPFPRRDLLLFVTMVVVLVTLVAQTVPLPWLLKRLRLRPTRAELTEAARARRATVDAALRELDELAAADEPEPQAAEALRQVLELRRDRLRGQLDGDTEGDTYGERDSATLRLRLLEVERAALRRLYDHGEISRGTLLSVSQELDLDETTVHARDTG